MVDLFIVENYGEALFNDESNSPFITVWPKPFNDEVLYHCNSCTRLFDFSNETIEKTWLKCARPADITLNTNALLCLLTPSLCQVDSFPNCFVLTVC